MADLRASTCVRLAWLVCLALLLTLPTSADAASTDDDSDNSGQSPAISAPDSSGYGWTALPTVTGATIDNATIVVGENATLLHYIDADYDATKIKRVVIQIHGDSRDAWNQWIYADLAAKRAVQGGTVKREEVLVVAPEFFENVDLGAYPFTEVSRANVSEPTSATTARRGAASRMASNISLAARSAAAAESTASAGAMAVLAAANPDAIVVTDSTEYFSASQALIFNGTNWGDGTAAISPTGNGNTGAFEALDALVDHFLNGTAFPALNRVVVAGFSLGGQLVQRYAAFRPDTSDDERMTFWVSSPNSFVYFNGTRPLTPKKACRDSFNDYKYGLEGTLPAYVSASTTSAPAIVSRFMNRKIDYLCGVRDKAAASEDCASNSQGSHHVSKMVYWTERVVPYLAGAPGDGTLPSNSSINWVAKTGHQDWKIITSDPGVYTLFLERYNDNGTDATAPPSNGVSATSAPSIGNGALSGLAMPSRVALVLIMALAASISLLV